MLVRFTKMHGIGNDFVVLDLISQRYRPIQEHIVKIADRHFGIGCDQVLIVEPPELPHNDFKYRIFNADGGEVEQCGNGARCFARYVYDKGLVGKTSIKVETAGGEIELHLEGQQVRVDMGPPEFEPEKVPFLSSSGKQAAYDLALDNQDQTLTIGAISMGNPHAVTRVEDIDTIDIDRLGPAVENHPQFPNRVNAGFMQVIDKQHIRLRVYERGVGETLACGTGACAAAVYGIQQGWLTSPVTVSLPGGDLNIAWQGNDSPVFLTGPAEKTYEGKISL